MMSEEKKGRAVALLPILVFLVIFLGAGIVFQDFYAMPAIVAFLIALLTAFVQNRKAGFEENIRLIAKGVGDDNIITMCLIFLAAGGFSGAVTAAGGASSTVNLGHYAGRCGSGRSVYYRMFYLCIHGNFHGDDRGVGADCGGNQ